VLNCLKQKTQKTSNNIDRFGWSKLRRSGDTKHINHPLLTMAPYLALFQHLSSGAIYLSPLAGDKLKVGM